MSNFFTSSIGKKFLMSLAGIFLMLFLLVHLGINLLIILCDSYEPFNRAAHFMGTNILIRIMEIFLFGGFLVHMIYGLIISLQNWFARPIGYKKDNYSQTSVFSKWMLHTSVVLIIFLFLHLMDFYIKAKFLGEIEDVIYDGVAYHDLAMLVISRFSIGWVVIVYIVSLLVLGIHLHHAFQSAFQTMGFNYPVYTPVIQKIGQIYCIGITTGFISIPVVVYFFF